MSNMLADYSKTVIYKIQCKDVNITDIYIGHTTCYYQRYRLHKSNCNNETSKSYNCKIYKIIRENGGWENWNMIIIEKYPCNNINEARDRERFWIEKESSTLNVTIPNRSKKEYNQIYRIIHREEISEKAKEYRENNKDKIKEYLECNKEKISFQKQDWYEENKEEILQKAKENYQENKEHKLEYQKQYSEEHKEEIAEKQKAYREKNKEKLAEQKKEYRATHKEEASKAHKEWREVNKEKLKEQRSQIITCECGSQYTFGNKNRHLQSNLHIDYQNKLSGIITEIEPKINEEEQLLIQKQKQKEYREKNADKIKEYKKTYNDKNKEHNKQQTHKYYEQHKEEIKLKTKEYVEKNKEKIKKYSDIWYQKNKEKILEKQKQVFLCECGSEVRCAGKAEHLRSIKHKNYIEGLQITHV
jgi:hypothetical protein